MKLINFYYNFSLKYQIILAVFNNYYLKQYENINSKIIFTGNDESCLMTNYEYIFNKVLKELSIEDFKTLKKFLPLRCNRYRKIFEYLDKNKLNYDKMVYEIKRIYTKDNSIYYNEFYSNTIKVGKNIKILFMRTQNICENSQILDVKDMVVLNSYSKYDFINHNTNRLLGAIKSYIDDYYLIENKPLNIKKYGLNVYLKVCLRNDFDIITLLENEVDNAIRDYRIYELEAQNDRNNKS